jgi:excisionase family DNA binding protein
VSGQQGGMRRHVIATPTNEQRRSPAASSRPTEDGELAVQPLLTPAQAAQLLTVPESWLRRKAGRRLVPCTFIGRHLRFSTADVRAIAAAGAQPARPPRSPHYRH